MCCLVFKSSWCVCSGLWRCESVLSGFVTAAGNSALLFQQTVSLLHISALKIQHECILSVNRRIVNVAGRLNWTLWCSVISSPYSPHSWPAMIWQRRLKPTATCCLSVTVLNRLTSKSTIESPPGPRAIPKAHCPEHRPFLTPSFDWSHQNDWQLGYHIWRKRLGSGVKMYISRSVGGRSGK